MENSLIEIISEKVNSSFESGGSKLESTHFENGRNLHSEQYYYAKRFFQNSDNCEEMSRLLSIKLQELNLPDETTLIGFRNYIGLLLNKTIKKVGRFNYALIEHDNSDFIWQHLPSLNQTLLIVLPITCTCSTYIKLRKFITDYIQEHSNVKQSLVSDHFINVFLILEKDIETIRLPLLINSLNKQSKLNKIYSAFNWIEINERSILFNNKGKNAFFAHPLLRLYSKLHLPESCELCFPDNDKLTNEKPLFPTHDNYETPNLIFGFPNFSNVNEQQDFFNAFSCDSKEGNFDIHIYGHTKVNNSHYMNYIQGNEFYLKNKTNILAYFNKKLKEFIKIETKSIIFITAENKHNSNFLEDICLLNSLSEKSVTILRFNPANEFIDNFISLHGKTLNQKDLMVIYFEEVISAGKTFKLISDYIKHSRTNEKDITGRHGFDLVISLVDRTLLYTHDEIIKKIKSEKNPLPTENFLTYFKLNVPIISAAHMGNPLIQRHEDLIKMVGQCHLDTIKIYISEEIIKQKPKKIQELQQIQQKDIELSYFPFENLSEINGYEVYKTYVSVFNKKQLNLLKLLLSHEINCELAKLKYQSPQIFKSYDFSNADFIIKLIENIKDKISPNIDGFFVEKVNIESKFRRKEIEFGIIHDTIIKILCRHPFLYYKEIFEAIFAYILTNFNNHHLKIESNAIQKFNDFRKLKFFIRRSVELNSNFIISKRFLSCIKIQYNKNTIEKIMTKYGAKKKSLITSYENGKIEKAYFNIAINNINHKVKQVSTYFTFLLYCYKELVYKNPYRSIKLEKLINSPTLLPSQISNPIDTDDELIKLINDPYFHFTGMVKAENIFLLNELKKLHKENITKENFKNIRDYADYYFGINKTKTHHNPIIINAQKLVSQSRFSYLQDFAATGSRKNELEKERGRRMNNVKNAVGNMLQTVSLLESKKSKNTHDLNLELKEILDSVSTILQPGIANGSLKYAFFVEFRERNISVEDTNNIYAIFSDQNFDNPETIYLNKEGLIYNMLYGLFDTLDATNQQALISTVKLKNDRYFSFMEKYFIKSYPENKCVGISLEELYKNDLSETKGGSGIKILDDANMSLIFRISSLITNENSYSDYSLKGQAVFVVTSDQESTTTNFLEFMSNEKVRLLLLIKDELLEYLQKQFENDSFNEILENRKRIIYQKHLRHGLNQYLTAQSKLIDNISRGMNSIENMEVFKIVTDAIRGQLKVTKLLDITEKSKISNYVFENKLRLIFESDILGDRFIPFDEVDISKFDFESIEIHPSIYDVIIPELIINMKKYCPRINDKELTIKIDNDSGNLIFSNRKNLNLINGEYGGGEGLKMCNHILSDILKTQSLDILNDDYQYIVKLKL